MSGLKQLKVRMNTVQSTQKITTAMKMISVSGLRKSHDALFGVYPFADEINRMVRRLVRAVSYNQERIKKEGTPLPVLLTGHEEEKVILIIALTSDEGLCGKFNQTVISKVEQLIAYERETSPDKKITLLSVGKRGGDILKRKYPELNMHVIPQKVEGQALLFDEIERMAYTLVDLFERYLFDTCAIVYSRFESAAVQKTMIEQLIPVQTFNHENKWQFLIDSDDPVYIERGALGEKKVTSQHSALFQAIAGQNIRSPLGAIDAENLLKVSTRSVEAYDYDGGEIKILEKMLPLYIQSYLYKVLLETRASENASRMMAMDNASRNAGDMMKRLHKTYHRKRQELVTRDLIEVISGFDAQTQGGTHA